MRAERDRVYGNIYQDEEGDRRWVGDVGEICMADWLSQQPGLLYDWILEDAAGRPDFVIGAEHGRSIPSSYPAPTSGRPRQDGFDGPVAPQYTCAVRPTRLAAGY